VSTRLQTPILTTVLDVVNAIYRDELDIKKFRRTLGSVTVKQDGSGGNVAFLTTAPHLHPRDAQEMGHLEFYDNTLSSLGNAMNLTRSAGCSDGLHVFSDTTMPFSLDETGRVRLLPSKPTNVLGDLPSYLEDNIFTRVMNEASRFILDLDDSRGFNDIAAPLYLNRRYRQLLVHRYVVSVMTVRMTAGSARTMLPNLHKLERLLNTEMDCFYERTDNRYSMNTSATFDFLFQFNINQPVKLRELRIHMLPFIFATSKTKGCHPVIFQLVTSVSGQQRYTTTLGVLRQRVLDALNSWKLLAKDAIMVYSDI
jgi:hypothetical protein